MKPEIYLMATRALDQFRRFFAKIAGGIASARPSPGPHREERERSEQRALPPDDKPVARTTPIARDDHKRRHAPSGSHPAVWPR